MERTSQDPLAAVVSAQAAIGVRGEDARGEDARIPRGTPEPSPSEERFRAMIEAVPTALVMVDQRGRITFVNAQAEHLFGYSSAELIEQPIELLVPERHRARHGHERSNFLGTPSTRMMGVGRDLYARRRNGTEFPVEIGLNPIETADGRFVMAAIVDITERKRSEDRLRLVVEAAPNAMIMVNRDGLMTLVNGQTEKLFGYSRAELIGKPVDLLVPRQMRAVHPHLRDSYFGNPQPRAMGAGRDLRGLTKDGRQVPIEIGLNPIETAEGTFVLAAIIDITERKRADNSLRESEQRFRQLVSGVKDYAILMLDPQGRVTTWNEGAERLKGYVEGEIVGEHFSRFYTAEDAAAGKPERELELARQRGQFEDEGWRVRKDGSRFWANVILTPIHDEQGKLLGYSKVTRDMTERRRSEERFRLLVEAAPNAMIMVSPEGRIALVNAQAEKLFEYSRQELVGMTVETLLPQRARGQHPQLRQGYIARPQARAMGAGRDLYGMTKGGREVPVEIGLSLIETADGPFVLASIADISERKRSELKLQELNQSLEAQVAETLATLQRLRHTQDQLVQAEKLASLGRLVAGLAHEINTPLGIGVTAASHFEECAKELARSQAAGTLTRSQLARFTADTEAAARILLSNLERAANLVQSFKRVAADQTSDERRSIVLLPYLQDVLLSLQPHLKKGPHTVELDCEEDLQLDTIPGALSQVLTNLIVNSLIHAFDEGTTGTMRITARRDGAGIRLIYADDGKGIAPENLPRIFEPFFTTRRGQGGTGLGLHIVFNLVHGLLGGTVGVTSTPGKGTEFNILLPATLPAQAVKPEVTP